MNFDHLFTTHPIHHAHFLVGPREDIVDNLIASLEKHFGIVFGNHSDALHIRYTTMSINDTHFLREREERKAFVYPKIFIVAFEAISFDAQQALLKLLEEPKPETYFFLVAPQDTLAPTLRSRVLTVHVRRGTVISGKDIVAKNPAERLALVKDMTTSITNEEKTKQDAIDLISVLEDYVYKTEDYPRRLEALHALSSARTFLHQSGAPIKLILEYVMVSV